MISFKDIKRELKVRAKTLAKDFKTVSKVTKKVLKTVDKGLEKVSRFAESRDVKGLTEETVTKRRR